MSLNVKLPFLFMRFYVTPLRALPAHKNAQKKEVLKGTLQNGEMNDLVQRGRFAQKDFSLLLFRACGIWTWTDG